jgi:hypothetical protein
VAKEWTPREMRHSFVSLLSGDGMPIEKIARLVGDTSTVVTETVYRQQIRLDMIEGAEVMDRILLPSSSRWRVTRRPDTPTRQSRRRRTARDAHPVRHSGGKLR